MTDKMIVLNVGLWVGGERPCSAELGFAVQEAYMFIREVMGPNAHIEGHSATDDGSREDTLVVVFEGYTGWRQDVFDLAEVMKQDCIACHIVFEHLPPKGILIGPNTKPWEPFNYTYFIHPKGTQ